MVVVVGLGVAADEPGDLQVWKSFREALRSGGMADPERYRPLHPTLREPMMGFLDEIRKTAEWEEEGPGPEVFHVGNRIHYIAPLTFRRGNSKETGTFCFSLVLEGGQWYFQQLEGIFIRLDKIGEPPVSSFPDLSDERKAWIRDEIQISKDVRLFAHLSREKGKDALPSTGSKTVAATPYRHKCGCPSFPPREAQGGICTFPTRRRNASFASSSKIPSRGRRQEDPATSNDRLCPVFDERRWSA